MTIECFFLLGEESIVTEVVTIDGTKWCKPMRDHIVWKRSRCGATEECFEYLGPA